MDETNRQLIEKNLSDFSEKIGVPQYLLDMENGYAKWKGCFNGVIDGQFVPMILRPMAIEANPNSSFSQLLFRTGEDSMNTEFGEVFHASFVSPSLGGYFQLFRFMDAGKRKELTEFRCLHSAKDGTKYNEAIHIVFSQG